MIHIDKDKLNNKIKNKYQVLNNALVLDSKTDWRDSIKTEIGDTKDPSTFHPQLKICRWDNEVNYSLRFKDDSLDSEEIYYDNEKVIWTKGNKEIHLYDKPSASEFGGYEIELILKSKPDKNKFEFSIETKNLDFYYQSSLTDEEILRKAIRPDNTIDSYAVYFKNGRAGDFTKKRIKDPSGKLVDEYDDLGKKTGKKVSAKIVVDNYKGKNYYCGKAFHIYRIKATDSAGNWVWGKQNIDTAKKLHTIEIPQEFLDSAVYPVVIDPTFGYTTAGAGVSTWTGTNANVHSSTLYDSDGGTITSYSIYAKAYYAFSLYLAAYTVSGGKPSTKLDQTALLMPADDTARWNNTGSVSHVTENGTTYCIAYSDAMNGEVNVYYDSLAGGGSKDATYNATLPTTWTEVAVRNFLYSMYATYEVEEESPLIGPMPTYLRL